MQKDIQVKLISEGMYTKIQIINVTYGFEQMLKNGKWENTTKEPIKNEQVILKIEKYFLTEDDLLKYQKSKFFKNLLKCVSKNY